MSSQPSMHSEPYIIDDKTDAERYFEGVLDGSVIAGQKMHQLAEKMLPRMRDGYKHWHYDPEAAIRPVRFMENFCVIPTGKLGQPLILEPYERMIVEIIFGFVDDEGRRQIQYAIIEVARKCGKALSLDTDIPTPSGWRKMGDLHVGDVVFGQDGRSSTIVAESEIFDKPMFLVTFEDGSQIKASGDHVWTVQTRKSRECAKAYLPGETYQVKRRKYREGGWFETTTQEMYDDTCFVYQRKDGKGVEYKYRVPMCHPVEYPEKDLPIDPYTFGYWLGDGSSNGPTLTISDDDLAEAVALIESRGHRCKVRRCEGKAPTVGLDANTCSGKNSNKFLNALRDLGVMCHKHIPDIYLQGSVEQRWELLRGLMDTDGYCSEAGQCEFTQKREYIVDQLIELCSSLGIKATKRSKYAWCNGEPCCTVYQAQFWTDKEHSCFHLRRKHDRLKEQLAPRMSCKSIVSIERIPNEPSKCMAIDNPSHLYLAGRHYTATHNTTLCAAIELYMLLADGEGAPQIYSAATSKAQAAGVYGAALRMVKRSSKLSKHVYKGTVVERQEDGIICKDNLGYITKLSHESSHLDGLDVHGAIYDELAAEKDRAAFDLIRQGTGAREQPLMIVITTQGFVRDNIWDTERDYGIRWLEDKLEDDRFLGIFFEMDDRSEIFNEQAWPKANPGLGTVKKWQYLRDQITKARNDPQYLPTVLVKDFNIVANQATSFFTFEEATCTETFEFDPNRFRYCVVGFDMAERGDLNAAVAMFMERDSNIIYEEAMYWIAEEQIAINSNSQKQRDGVPYHQWAADGWLQIVEGDKVDQIVFLDWMRTLVNKGLYIYAVGFDKWHVDDWTRRQLEQMVGKGRVSEVIQGALTLSSPMKEIKIDHRANRIIDNGNPVTRWCRLNVMAKYDTNDNVTPIKKGLTASNRIDGFMAELDAYITLKRHWEGYQASI